jgi:hypothetical protein
LGKWDLYKIGLMNDGYMGLMGNQGVEIIMGDLAWWVDEIYYGMKYTMNNSELQIPILH